MFAFNQSRHLINVHFLHRTRNSINVCAKCLITPFSSQTIPLINKNVDKSKTIIEKNIDFSNLDPDNFGNLGEKYKKINDLPPLKSEELPDDSDGYDKLEIKRGIKKSISAYGRIFNEIYHKKPRDVKKLLRLHKEFIYEDRYIPDRSMYTLLIDACADIGYTKKAIELYEEMKRFGLKPTKAAVTALFNSCGNCTTSNEYALHKTLYLRENLELSGYEFNAIQYNALIKAFAKQGDLKNANLTVEEMVKKGHPNSHDTICMLLMGCISNPHQGLLMAIELFNKLIWSDQLLDISSVNLFLRSIRDCKVGSEHDLLKLYSKIAQTNVLLLQERKNSMELAVTESGIPNIFTNSVNNQILAIDFNLLSLAKNRFLLCGGLEYLIHLMEDKKIKPNIKTITLIIDLLDIENCVDTVMNLLDKFQLTADVYLYNVLIKKAAKSSNFTLCQELISRMQQNHISPDIMTFGALTFCCFQSGYAKKLLKDMNNYGIVPNNQIMGSLINIACSREDLDYVDFLLNYAIRNNFQLSNIDVEQIDLFLTKTKNEIAQINRHNQCVSAQFNRKFQQALYKFQQLIKSTKFELNNHPWAEFEKDKVVNNKKTFNSISRFMQKKTDIKLQRQPKKNSDDDDIDD